LVIAVKLPIQSLHVQTLQTSRPKKSNVHLTLLETLREINNDSVQRHPLRFVIVIAQPAISGICVRDNKLQGFSSST
jgi:hypothetical protein